MRIRSLLTIFILLAGLSMVVPEMASARAGDSISTSDLERAVLRVFNNGRALKQIDVGYASGALTWDEAAALYAEQGVIRNAYIRGKAFRGRDYAARRAAFMLRMSQSTYARLAFNDEQRRPMDRRVTWVW